MQKTHHAKKLERKQTTDKQGNRRYRMTFAVHSRHPHHGRASPALRIFRIPICALPGILNDPFCCMTLLAIE